VSGIVLVLVGLGWGVAGFLVNPDPACRPTMRPRAMGQHGSRRGDAGLDPPTAVVTVRSKGDGDRVWLGHGGVVYP
jgi:hypothetical protein